MAALIQKAGSSKGSRLTRLQLNQLIFIKCFGEHVSLVAQSNGAFTKIKLIITIETPTFKFLNISTQALTYAHFHQLLHTLPSASYKFEYTLTNKLLHLIIFTPKSKQKLAFPLTCNTTPSHSYIYQRGGRRAFWWAHLYTSHYSQAHFTAPVTNHPFTQYY